MNKLSVLAGGVFAAIACAASLTVAAQSYPVRPVRLIDEIRVVLENPDTAKRLVQEGAEPAIKTPDELGRYVISEMDKWARVAKIAGIKGE